MQKILNYLILFSIAVFILGCAKEITTPQLNKAKTSYLQISKDPVIKQNAPLELIQAQKIYQKSNDVQSEIEANHVAYLLEKEVEIAKESAKQNRLKKEVEELKELKTKALIDAKMIELKAMKYEVDETKNQLLIAQKEAIAAKKLMQEKLKELKELHAKETNRGLVLTLGDVLFESGKTSLMPGAKRTIDKLAEFLASYPNRNVLIEGHTDNIGSEEYNIDLSLKRADAVASALIDRGIQKSRILTQGLGETYPVATNKTAEGRQKNRRVEIIVLKENVSHDSMKR